MTLPDLFGALPRFAREVPADDLPTLLGRLAEAEAVVRLRLNTVLPASSKGNGDADENLSATEAARRLGVSRDWLYKTDLPFKVRIGRRVVFAAVALERWNRQRMGRS